MDVLISSRVEKLCQALERTNKVQRAELANDPHTGLPCVRALIGGEWKLLDEQEALDL